MGACVLAAIDLGPSSARVLRHAAGFARLLSAPLRVLHVAVDATPVQTQRVLDFCAALGPYEVDLAENAVIVRTGLVSDAIYREASRQKARLIVIGSRGHGGLARLLLGSTSEAVLRNAAAPVLLVPPIDLDIVNITDRTALTCGPVIVPVDLAEASGDQLDLAGQLAQLAGQPLLLMTVRHGDVAEEISRRAAAEGSGLVVMGLRRKPARRPGAIASAVFRTNRAFVLAVPQAGHGA